MPDRYQQLLQTAAAGSLQRVRDDYETKASARVKPLLAYIEAHLLEPDLDSPKLMRVCNVGDRSMATVFRREIGATPTNYLRDRLMETAAYLLAETDLKVWEIGHLVFDVDINSFNARFTRWAHMSPTAYREAARKAATETGSLEEALRAFARAIDRGAGAESLTGDQRLRLIRHLRSIDGASRPLAVDGAGVERGIALTFWERLRCLPPEEQLELVRRPYGLERTALFDVLREKSREEGRKDRQAGVRVAELALASLDGVAAHLTPDDLANKKAQGLAWLGNARRLALDFPEAERTFTKARKALPQDPDPQVLAEICDLEADLFHFQSRFEKATELRDRAVDLFRSLGNQKDLAESLVARAATIGRAQGFELAIPDYLEAVQLAEAVKNQRLAACAHQGLVTGYALSGRIDQALERLPTARALCAKAGDLVMQCQLQWLEGTIARESGRSNLCEELFRASRTGFVAIGEAGYAAAVSLDLAALYLEQGRTSKAASHTLEAFPLFEHFSIHREALAALALLEQVAEDHIVSEEVIRQIRGCLGHVLQSFVDF